MIVGQTIEQLMALNAYARLDIMIVLMLYVPPAINVARLVMVEHKMIVRNAIPIFHLQALLLALVSVMILPNILIQMELARLAIILGYILYFF